MATKKKEVAPKKEEQKAPKSATETKYKGRQLLKMDKYNHRIGRIVLDAEMMYSFKEADELISNYGKR